METVDLSQYREDGSTEWYYEEMKRIGEERMYKLREYMYAKAAQMRCGTSINLLEFCTDKANLRLLVKICCDIIISYHANERSNVYFEFADSTYNIFRKKIAIMKIKQYIANLFDRMCKDAVISGLREEIEQLNAHRDAQNKYIEGLNEERDRFFRQVDGNRKYIEALLCNIESKGSMTYDEFVSWHNNYTGGWYSYLKEPKRIRLTVCSFCFQDMYEMTKHPRSWFKCKPELQIGTELCVRSITRNYYGTFYCCDVPEGVKIEKGCIPTYDIPVDNAAVIKWGEPKEDAV